MITKSLKEEILDLNNKLSIFGISFKSLTSMNPLKPEDKKLVINIINFILDDHSLINYIYTNKKLPMNMLIESLKIKKSFLKKNNDYIIGMLIIMENKSSLLYEFLKGGLN